LIGGGSLKNEQPANIGSNKKEATLFSEVTFCNLWRKKKWEQNMESVFPGKKMGSSPHIMSKKV
jgi:hypothetical protein